MTAAEERKENKKTIKNDSRIAALGATVGYVDINELNSFTGEKRDFNYCKTRLEAAAALYNF